MCRSHILECFIQVCTLHLPSSSMMVPLFCPTTATTRHIVYTVSVHSSKPTGAVGTGPSWANDKLVLMTLELGERRRQRGCEKQSLKGPEWSLYTGISASPPWLCFEPTVSRLTRRTGTSHDMSLLRLGYRKTATSCSPSLAAFLW